MQGLILTAGRGSRMRAFTRTGPKCLLAVGGATLLDRQVAALRNGGVERLGVVGGWRIESLYGRGIEVLHNTRWEETTMVESLCRADAWLAADTTLVSYGDIAFSPATARRLAGCAAPLALAYDRDWYGLWRRRFADPLEDAETFAVDGDGRVVDIGGRPRRGERIEGQYIGLMRWTPTAWARFGSVLRELQATEAGRHVDMTAALRRLVRDHGAVIAGVPVEGPWFEFDSEHDVELGAAVIDEIDRLLGATAREPTDDETSKGGKMGDTAERLSLERQGHRLDDLEVFDPPETYTLAARGYDAASPGWGRVIDHTLELLRLQPGDDVLDIGCGPGTLSVRAGQLVGESGSVTGVDIAEGMLEVARAKAAELGVTDRVTFERGDMHALRFHDGQFDAIACAFAMFFAQDVTAVGRELWRLLAPGGRLVVATIGEQFFEPMWTEFRRETARHRPDLDLGMPWERRQVSDGGTLCGLLAAGDVRIRRFETENVEVPLSGPDDWWTIAEGTGIRRAVVTMGAKTAQAVREANARWFHEHGITSVTISANYVVAERPPLSDA